MKFVVSVFFIVFCCLLVGFPASSLQVVNDKPKYGELTLEFEEETVIRESNDNEFYTFRYIWDLVVEIRQKFKMPVRIKGVRGNHGRQYKYCVANNNFDNLVFHLSPGRKKRWRR